MSIDREPVVAGQFYAGRHDQWLASVRSCMRGETEREAVTRLAMVPHAGHVFSGGVAGQTLARARLTDTVLLLGPNHTGMGAPLAVWPDGKWHLPGASLEVDAELVAAILAAEPALTADRVAHLQEHSLEVVLPFLWAKNPDMRIVPIAVGDPRPHKLAGAASKIAEVLNAQGRDVSVVVSSDMNHFASDAVTRIVDQKALDRILALDPMGFYGTVREDNISMCGVLPMTMGMHLANILGAKKAELVAYATSGDVNGDMSRVVGYAGVIIE
ncbi:AmmeMemoRadiSam system protein B [Desulfomicrobium escambiense]|uniref:AmmeMemoRadiSam system protein B n=1 Tax=Desulfomicrobium escambiense TaxID=29503 RepID=UPI000426DEA5|nr:AmmeMemoRadiSam system protein B [Desulfomicrobium escambiense]